MIKIATVNDVEKIHSLQRENGADLYLLPERKERILERLQDGKSVCSLYQVGSAAGYVSFAFIRDPGMFCLDRIVVTPTGKGHGKKLLFIALRGVFKSLSAHRVELSVVESNLSATQLYESAGFRREGVLRDAWKMPDGSFQNLMLFSLLKKDPEARQYWDDAMYADAVKSVVDPGDNKQAPFD